MMTIDNYKTLENLKDSNPAAYDALIESSDAHLGSLGFASHEIKNMVSFMNSSYQLISRQHPETADFRFWKEFGDNINHLIYFMDRTSVYRYCIKNTLSLVNIMDLLYKLPDEADNRHPDTERDFKFNMQTEISQSASVLADSEHMLIALNEIIDNCYDATCEGDTITISATIEDREISSNRFLHIAISNPGFFPDIEYSEPGSTNHNTFVPTDATMLCKPFYTTKPKRTGLGLSIAHNVCMSHNGEITFSQDGNTSTVHIYLPIC